MSPNTRKRYNGEFKVEVVKLVLSHVLKNAKITDNKGKIV